MTANEKSLKKLGYLGKGMLIALYKKTQCDQKNGGSV